MRTNTLLFLGYLSLLLFNSCNSTSSPINTEPPAVTYPPNAWYDKTKAEILRQASKEIDDIKVIEEKNNYKRTEQYSKGEKVKLEAIRNGRVIYDIHYANNGDFELRREKLCDNGGISFEGIVYQNEFYGYILTFHCNGQVMKTYFEYKGKGYGTYTEYNEDGSIKQVADSGSSEIEEMQLPDIFSKEKE